jgi:monofunctional biosynthetic peptidoglycan transglycosylase
VAKLIAGGLALLIAGLFLYGAKGYYDAVSAAPALAARADRLIAANRGMEGLGPGRIGLLLTVDDPGFWHHKGVDMTTAGAGMTSMTQSLSKRLAFKHFQPGLGKIRQTGYALGLERRLSKPQIVALFLDTAQMGYGPKGWMKGFYTASREIYGRPPAALDRGQFLTLVAVMIAPARFDLRRPDAALGERVARIDRLLSGRCRPSGLRDVWLEGCAQRAAGGQGAS